MKRFIKENSAFLIVATVITVLSLFKIGNAHANALAELTVPQLVNLQSTVQNADISAAKKKEIIADINAEIAGRPIESQRGGIANWQLMTMSPSQIQAFACPTNRWWTDQNGNRHCSN